MSGYYPNQANDSGWDIPYISVYFRLHFWHRPLVVEQVVGFAIAFFESLGPLNPTSETTIAQRIGFTFILKTLSIPQKVLSTSPDQWKGQHSFPPVSSSRGEHL